MADNRSSFPNVQLDIKDLQRRMDEQVKHFHTVRQAFEIRITALEADIKALTARIERQGAPRGCTIYHVQAHDPAHPPARSGAESPGHCP